jgi:hypothetical protein
MYNLRLVQRTSPHPAILVVCFPDESNDTHKSILLAESIVPADQLVSTACLVVNSDVPGVATNVIYEVHARNEHRVGWLTPHIITELATFHCVNTRICAVDRKSLVTKDSYALIVADLETTKPSLQLFRGNRNDSSTTSQRRTCTAPALCLMEEEYVIDAEQYQPCPRAHSSPMWLRISLPFDDVADAHTMRHAAIASIMSTQSQQQRHTQVELVAEVLSANLTPQMDVATLAVSLAYGNADTRKCEAEVALARLEALVRSGDELSLMRGLKRELMYCSACKRYTASPHCSIGLPEELLTNDEHVNLEKTAFRSAHQCLSTSRGPSALIELPFEHAIDAISKRAAYLLNGKAYLSYMEVPGYLMRLAERSWPLVKPQHTHASTTFLTEKRRYCARTLQNVQPLHKRFVGACTEECLDFVQQHKQLDIEDVLRCAPLCVCYAARHLRLNDKLFHDGRYQLVCTLLDLGFHPDQISDVAMIWGEQNVDRNTIGHLHHAAQSEIKPHPYRKRRHHTRSCKSMLRPDYFYKRNGAGCPYQTLSEIEIKGTLVRDLVVDHGANSTAFSEVDRVLRVRNSHRDDPTEACYEHMRIKCDRENSMPRRFWAPHQFVWTVALNKKKQLH